MKTNALVPLGQIHPNPFQMRQSEDPKAIKELSENIAEYGLMQVPTARMAEQEEEYELVFGHSRLAAYKLLAKSKIDYKKIELIIHDDLSDRQMFEMALAENVKRSDLNPIEIATSLKRYMEEFEATSEEAGELFGLKAATVRGKVRLLDLPPKIKKKVAGGELAELAARPLLTLQRIAPTAMGKVEKRIEEFGAFIETSDVAGAVGNFLRNSSQIVLMHDRWSSKPALGGSNLWPLSTPASKFPFEYLPSLSKKLQESDHKDHFAKPPKCTACLFYAKANGAHYCGLKTCHTRKKKAWQANRLEAASVQLGIPIYNKKEDGRAEKLEGWQDGHRDLFAKRDESLRLALGQTWNNFDGQLPDGMVFLITGEEARARLDKQKEERTQRESVDYRLVSRRVEDMKHFMWANVIHFVEPLKAITLLPLLKYLAVRDNDFQDVPSNEPAANTGRSKKLDWYRRAAMFQALWESAYSRNNFERQEAFIELTSKHLKGFAKEWGITLPKNWAQLAKDWPPLVSVETEGEGG